jgi:hypothetical protein
MLTQSGHARGSRPSIETAHDVSHFGLPGSAAGLWAIAETGDFNNDGRNDVLWYNTAAKWCPGW